MATGLYGIDDLGYMLQHEAVNLDIALRHQGSSRNSSLQQIWWHYLLPFLLLRQSALQKCDNFLLVHKFWCFVPSQCGKLGGALGYRGVFLAPESECLTEIRSFSFGSQVPMLCSITMRKAWRSPRIQESVPLVLPGQELGNRELRLEPGLGYTFRDQWPTSTHQGHLLKAPQLPWRASSAQDMSQSNHNSNHTTGSAREREEADLFCSPCNHELEGVASFMTIKEKRPFVRGHHDTDRPLVVCIMLTSISSSPIGRWPLPLKSEARMCLCVLQRYKMSHLTSKVNCGA